MIKDTLNAEIIAIDNKLEEEAETITPQLRLALENKRDKLVDELNELIRPKS